MVVLFLMVVVAQSVILSKSVSSVFHSVECYSSRTFDIVHLLVVATRNKIDIVNDTFGT